MRNLEGRIKSSSSSTTDAVVVDAMFFIQSLISLPPTYVRIAKKILSLLLQFGNHVHFVCDTYQSPSIKDTEHVNRECSPTEIDYNISGPEQKRSKDFTTALKSGKFKTNFSAAFPGSWVGEFQICRSAAWSFFDYWSRYACLQLPSIQRGNSEARSSVFSLYARGSRYESCVASETHQPGVAEKQ